MTNECVMLILRSDSVPDAFVLLCPSVERREAAGTRLPFERE
jgi:hypothetical protein